MIYSKLIGPISDQSGNIWFGDRLNEGSHIFDYYGLERFTSQPTVFQHIFSSSEFIYVAIYSFLAYLLGGVAAYNLITIIVLALNAYFFYRLLSLFKVNNYLKIVYSLVFVLSPYFYFHLEHHPLLFVFPTLYMIEILLKHNDKDLSYKQIAYLSFITVIQTFLSNYLGYFALMTLGIFFVYRLVLSKTLGFRKFVSFYLMYFLIAIPVLLPYFYANFYTRISGNAIVNESKYNLTINFNEESQERTVQSDPPANVKSEKYYLHRPIEDFFYFTSRPWFLIMPPVSHPITGDTGKFILDLFKNKWGSWLAQNYFEAEHSSAYLGLINMVFILMFLYRKIKTRSFDAKDNLNILFVVAIVLTVLTMPPYITVGGLKIYNITYLIANAVPIFRSLIRLAVIINAIVLILSIVQFQYLINKYKLPSIIIFVLSFVLAFDYTIPFTIVNVYKNSDMYTEIGELNKDKNYLAIYPNKYTGEGLINMKFHRSPLINPPGYIRTEIGFNSKNFTDDLSTQINLDKFKSIGGKYIILYKDINQDELNEFMNSPYLIMLKEYNEAYLFELKY